MSINPRKPRPPLEQADTLERPTNALHSVGNAIGTVVGAPGIIVDKLNTGFANATNVVANVLPSFPAATVGNLAMGIPHAHIAHPPSGPPPIPPTPLPPIGTTMFGCCVQVLIGGMPAARAGDIGLSPTCCALTPMFEHFTGSSNVFIGGARAARVMDATWHCRAVNDSAKRAAAQAQKAGASAAQMAMIAAMMVPQVLQIAGDAYEAVEADNSAMSAALAQNAAMMSAQMASDMVGMAMANVMGKDQPCVPPTGTLGMISNGSPNVLIGGFPMPSWTDIAKGIMKLAKGLKAKMKGKKLGDFFCGCPK